MSKTHAAMISLAISTVNRPENYVHKLTPHLPKGLPIRLIVGSPSYDYLERYRRNPHIEIIGIDPDDWNRIKDYRVAHRASWNYWRCFVYGVRPGKRKGLLILEDDVIPARGWEQRLHDTIHQIESQYGEDYVLALYNCYMKLSKPSFPGSYYARYPARAFGGTQAMYYPESIRAAFAEYLGREGVETFRLPYDWLLNEYLGRTGIPLFATTPSLFEHIGKVTTGLGPFHRAGYFTNDLERTSNS